MKLRKLKIGNFLSFVRDGTTISGSPPNVVGPNFRPDAASAAFQTLGCILDINPAPVVETETDYCPVPTGGYEIEEEEATVQDVWNATLKVYNALIWEMIFGTAAPLEDGTVAIPFARKNRVISGWLLDGKVAEQGGDKIIEGIYRTRMRLNTQPTWNKDTSKPSVKFTFSYSPLGQITPTNIVS